MKKLLLGSLLTVLSCSAFALSADLEAKGFEALASDDISVALAVALDKAQLECKSNNESLGGASSVVTDAVSRRLLDDKTKKEVAIKSNGNKTEVFIRYGMKSQTTDVQFTLSQDETQIVGMDVETFILVNDVENTGTITSPKLKDVVMKKTLHKYNCSVK